ncbi:MAG: IS21 family transposase [Candidatus Aegiribacteria sp.]|nr:IS21 family transposase [Candidatus Aegiribacteria sp.]
MNHILDVLHRLRQKQSVRSITRDTGISRKTVVSYRDIALANGWLDEVSSFPTREELGDYLTKKDLTNYPPQNISSVEPHRVEVKRMLRRNYTMKRIFVLLHENFGYNGSYSSVYRFCNKINPPASRITCRVTTSPGEIAQVDFGTVTGNFEGNNRKPLYVFVMTLCYSRHMYVEFVEDQKMATFIRCHVNAFNFFGGVPGTMVPDNLKAAVIKASFTDPVLSESYRCCARHYGFRISPTNPYTPQHKGKVESGVKYVKKAYCDGSERTSLADLNRSVRRWCREEAGTRIHGTTKEQPMILFEEEEREALEKLPAHSYELLVAKRFKLSRDCHLEFDQNYYSAPYQYVGQQLEVYAAKELRLDKRRCYEKTDEFKEKYRKRSGIEATNSGIKQRTGMSRLRVRGKPSVFNAILLKIAGWNILQAARSEKSREYVRKRVPWNSEETIAAMIEGCLRAIRDQIRSNWRFYQPNEENLQLDEMQSIRCFAL